MILPGLSLSQSILSFVPALVFRAAPALLLAALFRSASRKEKVQNQEKTAVSDPRENLERKMSDLKKRCRKEREYFFENSPLICVELAPDGTIVDLNRAFANLLNRPKEDLKGKRLVELAEPGARTDLSRYLERHLAGEASGEAVIDFTRGEEKKSVRFGEQHLATGSGARRGVLLAGVDATAAERAGEKEAELKSRIGLSARMEELGMLAGGIAHDLKNVFSPLVAYPDALIEQLPHDSSAQKTLLRIKQSAFRALAMTQNFLALARRGRIEDETVDLNRLVDHLLDSLEVKALRERNRSVELEAELEDGIPVFQGNVSQLANVILNLVRNALEAMPSGGKITISTGRARLDRPRSGLQQIPRGEYCLLSVSDQGKGMTPDEAEHLFEPFFSTKEMDLSGTGLGLLIVNRVMEDHRGYIDLQTEVGKGTRFTLYFPV